MDERPDKHRLPTFSASEALQGLRARGTRTLSTGLPKLDALLASNGPTQIASRAQTSGIGRGQVIEIFGPPGSGKTIFGLQICASALREGSHATWIDTGTPLKQDRLDEVYQQDDSTFSAGWEQRFHYFNAPTLPHLLALIMHHQGSITSNDTGVIVIDTVSAPFERAYARPDRKTVNADAAKWAAARRFSVMSDLARKINQIAITNDLVVVLICQCATQYRQGAPMALIPSITSREWDSNIATQIALMRDWLPTQRTASSLEEKQRRAFFASLRKATGTQYSQGEEVSTRIAFTIEKGAVVELELEPVTYAVVPVSPPARSGKRPFEEIADSDADDMDSDEEYGWADEDEVAAEKFMADQIQSDPVV